MSPGIATVGTRGISVSGQVVNQPKAQGYNLRIGDVWFRTIASPQTPLTIGTRDSLAERQDRAGSVYENVLDIGYAWSRTDLSGGEGLDWDPREMALFQDQAALDQLRFFSSSNIDVSRPATNGEQYTLRLSNQSEQALPNVTFDDLRDITTSSVYIYVADGDTVFQYGSWTDLVSIATWEIVENIAIHAIAASPSNVVAAILEDGTLYMKNAADGSLFIQAYSDTSQPPSERQLASGVWYVHGRFVFSTFNEVKDAGVLWSLDWNAIDLEWQETEIDTADSAFMSVVESGPAVVASNLDGTVRTYTPDISTGSDYHLIPRGRTSMPEGERPILMGSNSGVLLIMATADTDLTGIVDGQEETLQTVRMYQAEVLDARFDYIVGQMQLRRTWFASFHEPLVTRNMTVTRDEILWFVRELIDGTFTEALWRFDVVTNGLSRRNTYPGINLNGMVVFDALAAGIDFNSESILVQDRDTYQDSGWIVFPNITFGVNTPITWMASIVEAQNLASSGTQVELWRTSDPQGLLDWQDPSWTLVQRLSAPGNTNLEIPMLGVKSRTLALQLRMFNHSGGTETPKVTRIAMRGIPSHRDFIMQIPMNISDYVSVPGRAPLKVPGFGYDVHNRILDMIGDNVQVAIIDPPVVFEGVINNISEPIEYLAERGSVTRYVMVEFRGQRSTATIPTTGDAGMGLGFMGIATMGIGQTERT